MKENKGHPEIMGLKVKNTNHLETIKENKIEISLVTKVQEDFKLNKLAKSYKNFCSEGFTFITNSVFSGILEIAKINLREGVK